MMLSACSTATYAFLPQGQELARKMYPAIVMDTTSQKRYGDFLRGVLSAEGGVSVENFEQTLDLIDAQYGSLTAYLEKALGFSAAEQEKMKQKYLK